MSQPSLSRLLCPPPRSWPVLIAALGNLYSCRERAGCRLVQSVIPWRSFSSGDGEHMVAGARGGLETDSPLVTSGCLASGKSLHCSEPPFSQLEK